MSARFSRRRFLSHGLTLAGGGVVGWLAARTAGERIAPVAEAADEETPEARLRKLGLALPRVTPPKATLVPAVRVGDLLFVSGFGPSPRDGKPFVGRLGKELTLKDGQAAAVSIALTTLAVVRAELGSLDKVKRLVKTLGMVNCTPDFVDQPQVINGFSDLMVRVFGPTAGKGARSAVGMVSLPGGIPVEIESVFQVRG